MEYLQFRFPNDTLLQVLKILLFQLRQTSNQDKIKCI